MVRWMTVRSDFRKRRRDFRGLQVDMVRSEGLEPPRFYSLPPQGSASTNSATSASASGPERGRAGATAREGTNHGWGDKALCAPTEIPFRGASALRPTAENALPGAGAPWQHLLDLDRDPVAV